jgi:hypothetical protein
MRLFSYEEMFMEVNIKKVLQEQYNSVLLLSKFEPHEMNCNDYIKLLEKIQTKKTELLSLTTISCEDFIRDYIIKLFNAKINKWQNSQNGIFVIKHYNRDINLSFNIDISVVYDKYEINKYKVSSIEVKNISYNKEFDLEYNQILKVTIEKIEEIVNLYNEFLKVEIKKLKNEFNNKVSDINKKFDDINKKFDDINKKFDDINKKLVE